MILLQWTSLKQIEIWVSRPFNATIILPIIWYFSYYYYYFIRIDVLVFNKLLLNQFFDYKWPSWLIDLGWVGIANRSRQLDLPLISTEFKLIFKACKKTYNVVLFCGNCFSIASICAVIRLDKSIPSLPIEPARLTRLTRLPNPALISNSFFEVWNTF